MDIEELFNKHVGGCGLYQILFHFGVTSIAVILTIDALEYGFIGATPKFWCSIPELSNFNLTQDEIAAFVSPPATNDVTGYDACLKYSRNYSDVTEADIVGYSYSNWTSTNDVSTTLVTTKCTQWTYDTSVYENTVVTEVYVMYMHVHEIKLICINNKH